MGSGRFPGIPVGSCFRGRHQECVLLQISGRIEYDSPPATSWPPDSDSTDWARLYRPKRAFNGYKGHDRRGDPNHQGALEGARRHRSIGSPLPSIPPHRVVVLSRPFAKIPSLSRLSRASRDGAPDGGFCVAPARLFCVHQGEGDFDWISPDMGSFPAPASQAGRFDAPALSSRVLHPVARCLSHTTRGLLQPSRRPSTLQRSGRRNAPIRLRRRSLTHGAPARRSYQAPDQRFCECLRSRCLLRRRAHSLCRPKASRGSLEHLGDACRRNQAASDHP